MERENERSPDGLAWLTGCVVGLRLAEMGKQGGEESRVPLFTVFCLRWMCGVAI